MSKAKRTLLVIGVLAMASYLAWTSNLPAESSGDADASTVSAMLNQKGYGTSEFEKPSKADLRKQLTPLQFRVTQESGTERSFSNEYWDNKADGIYVDVVSGEPLFTSQDKYKSGTGWPSFSRPIRPDAVTEKTDYYLILPRTEIRSKIADSHLGHVFRDGPEPTGKRYCMNSAAMRFVPANKLAEEGYEEFAPLFESPPAE